MLPHKTVNLNSGGDGNMNIEIRPLKKHETKTLLLARYRMLECGVNFKGSLNEICCTCNAKDNEEHRFNQCIKYRNMNFYKHDNKLPFKTVFSDEVNMLKKIIPLISQVWNTRNANGTMVKS